MADVDNVIPMPLPPSKPIAEDESKFRIQAGNPFGFESADDVKPALNMRNWVSDAVVAKGAKVVGGGIGFGQINIDIELEGHLFTLSIRALER